MKRFLKIAGFTVLGIVVIYQLLPTGSIGSAISKQLLLTDPLLADFHVECKYEEPNVIRDSGPILSCTSTQRFTIDEQKVEIKRMKNVLEQKGWTASKSNTNELDITYYKSHRTIQIQPYDWEPGRQDKNSKILVSYSLSWYF